MNQKEKYMLRRIFLDKLDLTSRGHMNCLRFSKNETYDHKFWKFSILDNVCKDNKQVLNLQLMFWDDFLTEVYSECRKFRADIILFTEPAPTVVEIAVSEKEESLEKKRIFWKGKGFDYEVVKIE